MLEQDAFQLGYVLRAHGLKGQLMAQLETDQPEAYLKIKTLFVMAKQGLVPYKVEAFSLQPGDKALIKLATVDSSEMAETFKSAQVFLPLTELPQLEDDQFYYHEIEGFDLIDETTGPDPIGKVMTVYEAPQQMLLSVMVQGREALIPLNDDFLVSLDKEAKRIIMRLPEGLIDLYLSAE